MEQPRERVFGLDLARAAAIWMVLLNHLLSLLPRHPGWGRHLNILGMAGVDLFFALSGYLIGGMLLRGVLRDEFREPHHVGSFLTRRWLRTIPNYIAWFAVYHWYYYSPEITWGDRLRALFFVSDFKHLTALVMGQSWSLMVEEWFYLLFPVLLFINLRSWARRPFVAVAVTALPFLVVPFILKCVRTNFSADFDTAVAKIYAITPLRLDSIMFGVLGAVAAARYPAFKSWMGRRWLHLGLGAAFLAVTVLAEARLLNPLSIFYLLDVVFCLWVIALDRAQQTGTAWWSGFITWSSKLSYSLYLAHLIVWDVVEKALDGIWPHLPLPVLHVVLIAAVFLVSWISWRLVEQPFLTFRDRHVGSETFVGINLWPWAKFAALAAILYFLVPIYYEGYSGARIRHSAGAGKGTPAKIEPVNLWGKNFAHGIRLEISGEGDPEADEIEITPKKIWLPFRDFFKFRLHVTLPRSDGVPNKGKAITLGNDIYLKIDLKADGHRKTFLRRRLDPNEMVFDWLDIEVPVSRDVEKIEVQILQHNPQPAPVAPRTAWLAF